MKLENKHIVPYLLHKLSVKVVDRKYLNEGDNFGYLVSIDVSENSENLCISPDHAPYYLTEIDKIKPVLRPLSDLTKEIEIDGKKFTPIIELALLSELEYPEVIRSSEGDVCVCSNRGCHALFSYKNNAFIAGYVDLEDGEWEHDLSIYNQLELIDKLLSWHFDVYRLIQADLAIDINTIK